MKNNSANEEETMEISKNRNQKYSYITFLFLAGSIAGWCMEVIFRSVCNRELIIPGFLNGAYCPIYGLGVLLIVYVCAHKNKGIAYIQYHVPHILPNHCIFQICPYFLLPISALSSLHFTQLFFLFLKSKHPDFCILSV
jgi:hypothetical protein